MEIRVKDHLSRDYEVRNIHTGEIFGEVALIYKCRRTATVSSKVYSNVATITSPHFDEMMRRFPDVHTLLKKETTFYQDPWKKFQKEMIKYCYNFSSLSDPTIEELSHLFSYEFYEEGTFIF